MKRIWYIVIAIIIIIAGLVITAMIDQGKKAQAPHDGGSMGSTSPTSNASTENTTAVTINNFSFSPTTITVKVGDTVTWNNNDSTSHTVTADDGTFDSGTILKGTTFQHTFSKVGEYNYHCTLHPDMKAKVIVQ